jgi:uncharacterized protein YodC (DUF2158 family)
MTDSITVDCMVCRTSGGPTMLVLAVHEGQHGAGPVAQCAWFDGHKLDRATIAVDELDLMFGP